MKYGTKNEKFGYSIIETLIYSTILALIVILSVASVISWWRGFEKIKVDGQLTRNGEFALERITRDARLAESIGGASSSFGVSPGILELLSGATSTKYFLSDQVLQRKDSGNSPEDITSGDTKVTNIIFWNESASSTVSSRIIKIEFTLESGEGTFLKQKKFFGSAVLRGSY